MTVSDALMLALTGAGFAAIATMPYLAFRLADAAEQALYRVQDRRPARLPRTGARSLPTR